MGHARSRYDAGSADGIGTTGGLLRRGGGSGRREEYLRRTMSPRNRQQHLVSLFQRDRRNQDLG